MKIIIKYHFLLEHIVSDDNQLILQKKQDQHHIQELKVEMEDWIFVP
jgi:hypothetical protein